MAFRKNKKRIDPRYFLSETTYRDEIEEGSEHDAEARGMAAAGEEGEKAGKAGKPPRSPNDPEYMRGYKKGKDEGKKELEEVGSFTTNMPDDIPTTAQVMQQMGAQTGEEESFSVSGPDPKDALSTDDLFKLFKAGISPEDLRGISNANLTPEMASVLGHGAPGAPTGRDYYADESPYDTGY